MYKRTAELSHFLPRTGSHSTKGSRSGRVDVLPPNAQEQVFDDLDNRRQILKGRLTTIRASISSLNAEKSADPLFSALNNHSVAVQNFRRFGGQKPQLPQLIYEHHCRRDQLVREQREIESALHDIERLKPSRKQRQESFGELFVAVAKAMLDESTFNRLREETRLRFNLSEESR